MSIETVNRALGTDRLVLLILQHSDADDPAPDDLHRVGTVGTVRQMAKASGGTENVTEASQNGTRLVTWPVAGL